MIEHIVGRRSKGLSDVERGVAVKGDVLLELDNVSGRHKPENVSLTLHRGEVLGLAGLLGSGRSSLARVMAGIDPVAKGEIRIKGRAVTIRKPGDAIAAGVALVPEARATQGIIPDHSVASNMILAVIDRLSKGCLVDTKAANDLTDAQIERLRVKTASRDHAVSTLSGGNQQKVVIGKWLATNPDILILDEPTAGIDIGSKSEIIRLVRELAAAGKGIIMISSELSELLTACDRILVMADGRIHQDLSREALDDPSVPADDLAHRLQAAEQRLSIEIQKALAVQEVSHG